MKTRSSIATSVVVALSGVLLFVAALTLGGDGKTAAADSSETCTPLTNQRFLAEVGSAGFSGPSSPQTASSGLKTFNGVRFYCTSSGTATPSPTATSTVSQTATSTQSATATSTTSASPTGTATSTPTGTVPVTQTPTKTPSPTATSTTGPGSPTPTQVTPSPTATNTPSPTATSAPSPTPSPTPTQVSCTPDAAGSYGYEMPPNNFVALVNHLTICPGVQVSVQYKPPTDATSVTIQVQMDKTQMPSNAQEAAMVKVGDTWTYSFTARSSALCEGDPSCGQGQMAPDTSLTKLYIQFVYTDATGPHVQLQRFK